MGICLIWDTDKETWNSTNKSNKKNLLNELESIINRFIFIVKLKM